MAQAGPPPGRGRPSGAGPPQRILDKIDAAKARRPGRIKPYIKPHALSPDIIEEVRCKLCDAPIRALISDDRFFEQTVIGTQTIQKFRMVMATLPNYQELEITFDDGSKHVTNTCKACSTGLRTIDLEDLYAIDMEQNRHDAARVV